MSQLDTVRQVVGAKVDDLAAADTPGAAFAALLDLERTAAKAREVLAVHLVLDDGWSYAQVGRALGITRQAALKAYGPAVAERMRRNLRAAPARRAEPAPARPRAARPAAAAPKSPPVAHPTEPVTPTGAGRLVIVPCGTAKLDHAAPAGEMYVGTHHRACRRAADRIGGRVLILSALHGLQTLDTVIEPYNVRMGQPGAVTVATLQRQAQALGVDQVADVVVLGGRRYVDSAAAVWPHARRPLDGCTSQGDQLARLASLTRDGLAA